MADGTELRAAPPTIAVTWDPESQTVGLSLDPADFKTWDFVLAVLDMARQRAEELKKATQIAAMQQQAAQQAEGRMLAAAVANGRPGRR